MWQLLYFFTAMWNLYIQCNATTPVCDPQHATWLLWRRGGGGVYIRVVCRQCVWPVPSLSPALGSPWFLSWGWVFLERIFHSSARRSAELVSPLLGAAAWRKWLQKGNVSCGFCFAPQKPCSCGSVLSSMIGDRQRLLYLGREVY